MVFCTVYQGILGEIIVVSRDKVHYRFKDSLLAFKENFPIPEFFSNKSTRLTKELKLTNLVSPKIFRRGF